MASGASEFAALEGEGGGKFTSGGAGARSTATFRHMISSVFEDGVPSLSAVIDFDCGAAGANWTRANLRAYTAASKTWLLSGTNAATANAVLDTRGGILLTTAGANGDQMVISPLVINGVQMSPFGKIGWSPEYQPNFDATIRLGSAVTAQRILAGFKLTSVNEDHDNGTTPTDANYCLFVYDTDHGANAGLWHMATGVSSTITNEALDSGAARRVTARALDRLRLQIKVDNNRVPNFFIDNVLVGVGPEMNTALSLIPVIGIQALAGAAKTLAIHSVECSQNL